MNESTSNQQQNMNRVRALAEQVFSAGRLELVDELVHPDFHDYSAPEGLRDRDGFRQIVQFWRMNTSKFQVKVVKIFATDEWVGMVDETSGVHDRNEIFGVAPNGASFAFEAVHAFRMQEGKMREHWVQTSVPEVLQGWIGQHRP